MIVCSNCGPFQSGTFNTMSVHAAYACVDYILPKRIRVQPGEVLKCVYNQLAVNGVHIVFFAANYISAWALPVHILVFAAARPRPILLYIHNKELAFRYFNYIITQRSVYARRRRLTALTITDWLDNHQLFFTSMPRNYITPVSYTHLTLPTTPYV